MCGARALSNHRTLLRRCGYGHLLCDESYWTIFLALDRASKGYCQHLSSLRPPPGEIPKSVEKCTSQIQCFSGYNHQKISFTCHVNVTSQKK